MKNKDNRERFKKELKIDPLVQSVIKNILWKQQDKTKVSLILLRLGLFWVSEPGGAQSAQSAPPAYLEKN